MATIRHHARIARSADDVWKVVSDAAGITNWFPGVDSASADDTTRTIAMGPGMEIVEAYTADHDLRRFQYRIVEAPMPVEFHLATIDVLEDGDGSLVVYSSEIEPAEGKDLMDAVIASGLAGLKAHLEA